MLKKTSLASHIPVPTTNFATVTEISTRSSKYFSKRYPTMKQQQKKGSVDHVDHDHLLIAFRLNRDQNLNAKKQDKEELGSRREIHGKI